MARAFHLIFAEMTSRTTHLLLDAGHRIIGVLAGQPRNTHGWRAVHDDALTALKLAATSLNFTEIEEMEGPGGRRGSFSTIAYGLSFGGGQKVCASFTICCCLLRVV